MPSPTEIKSLLDRRAALHREATNAVRESLDAHLENPATSVELAITIRNPGSPPSRTVVISSDRDDVAAIVKAYRTGAEQRLAETEAELRKHGISDEPAPTARRASAQPHPVA